MVHSTTAHFLPGGRPFGGLSPAAQTTRNRPLGIRNGADLAARLLVVFLGKPGG